MVDTEFLELSEKNLRQAYGMFPSGVTAVCALIDSVPVGLAASSFTSVSIDPPLVSVCVAHASTTWPTLRTAPVLGISVLAAEHGQIARALASKTGDRFADISYELAQDSSILVHGATLWLSCAIENEVPAGDHDIIVLRVQSLRPYPDVAPMIFHASKFGSIVDGAADS